MNIVADGQTDNLPALKAAVTSTGVVDLPEGVIVVDGVLEIDSSVILRGKGGGFRAARTELKFINGGGIRIRTQARGTQILNLAIRGDRAIGTHPLVWSEAAVTTIDRCHIHKCGTDGIRIEGREGDGTNANGWTLSHVWIEDCDGWAVTVQGGDSQAAVALDLHAIDCGGGFYDGSFLGCTWIGCHAEYCSQLGGYLHDGPAARAVFLGCYCENDSWHQSWIGSPAIVLGGTLAAAIKTKPGSHPVTGQLRAPWQDAREMGDVVHANIAGGARVNLVLGAPGDGRTAWSVQDKSGVGADPHEWSLRSNPSLRTWSLERARSALHTVLAWTRSGHNLGIDQLLAPKGIHLGTVAGRHVRYASTEPGPLVGAVGDVVLATHPTSCLDGWRKCDDGNGPFWRPFVWGAAP